MAVPLRDRLCFLSRVRAVLGRGAAGGEGGPPGGVTSLRPSRCHRRTPHLSLRRVSSAQPPPSPALGTVRPSPAVT